jgi:hypothetical protein
VEGATSGFGVSGSLMTGVAVYNPTYAARPDNTGRALMRYAGHADIDLVGRRLSIPLDVNLFTDRDRAGAREFAPTELDLIGGVTSTWGLGPTALELGTRVEHDRPVDRDGASQTYVDARARLLASAGAIWPGLRDALRNGDVGGTVTLGWFAHNPSYFARPDNTGRALLRYAARGQISVLDGLVAFGLDATMFTDREASNPLRPSELDLTPEIIFHRRAFELHVAYERDMPLDRGGLVQQFVYVLGVWSFSLLDPAPAPPAQPAPPGQP